VTQSATALPLELEGAADFVDLSNLAPLPADVLAEASTDPADLHTHIRHLIIAEVMNDKRSLQREIGISEIGTPCTRKLVYKLGQVPECHSEGVKWRTAIGRATHTFLADMLVEDNHRLGYTRWLVENSVSPGRIGGTPLVGHSDFYDRLNRAVLDWKVRGPAGMKRARKGVPPTSRVQVHTYGLGFVMRGLPVERVHIINLPSAGELRDAVYWSEPYDQRVAIDAMAKANAVANQGAAIGFGPLAELAATADDFCTHCEWWAPGAPDPAHGRCPGSEEIIAERARGRAGAKPEGLG
jgi:hypothetical protein